MPPLKRHSRKARSTVVIIDDHPLIREGLSRLIEEQPDLAVCGQAHTSHEAMEIIRTRKPAIAILDLTLMGDSGMELIERLKALSLKTKVLVLSMHQEALYAERVLRAGAQGYIMKQEATTHILQAIRRILDGEIYLSEKMSLKMLHKVAANLKDTRLSAEGLLSNRELRVFQLIGQGRGTREIAEELHVSVKTVESYRGHIKIKMNLKNARELTQHAIHWVESNHLN